MEIFRFLIGIIVSLLMIALGANSLITKVWQYRSGNLASEEDAIFYGGLAIFVGLALLIIQIFDKLKDKLKK